MSGLIAFLWFAAGLATGALVTAMYYQCRIQIAVEALSEDNRSLRDAVNRSQPKE